MKRADKSYKVVIVNAEWSAGAQTGAVKLESALNEGYNIESITVVNSDKNAHVQYILSIPKV